MDYSLLVGIHDMDKAEDEMNESVESEENGVEEDEDSGGSLGQLGGNQTPPDSPLCPVPPTTPLFTGDIDPDYEPFAVKSSSGTISICFYMYSRLIFGNIENYSISYLMVHKTLKHPQK